LRHPDFGLGVVEVAGDGVRVWKCYYSLFCTESMLGSGMFSKKRGKLAQKVGVNGKNWNLFWRNDNFVS